MLSKRTTPLQHGLERQLVEKRLSRSLRNPLRPSKKDLVEHGIYIDATPRELQMEVNGSLGDRTSRLCSYYYSFDSHKN